MATSRNKKHGLSKTPTYITWSSMKARCTGARHTQYKYYGAKGITYDPSWASFEVFLADMGERPDGHTLDRIDSNANYNKENCRWATPKMQARNRTSNRPIAHKGEEKTVAEWAEELGMKYVTLLARLNTNGWDIEKAFNEQVAARITDEDNELCRGDIYEWQGESHTLAEWSRRLDIPIGTMYSRLRFGYPLEEVFKKKVNPHKYLTLNGETKLLTEWAKEIGVTPQKIRGRLKSGWSVERALDAI